MFVENDDYVCFFSLSIFAFSVVDLFLVSYISICFDFFYASFLRADLLKLQIESSRAERLLSPLSCDDSATFDIDVDAAGVKLVFILPADLRQKKNKKEKKHDTHLSWSLKETKKKMEKRKWKIYNEYVIFA